MRFISFGNAAKKEEQIDMKKAGTLAHHSRQSLIKVGNDLPKDNVGGFMTGIGQGVGIGVGLLALGAAIAFVRGKRIA